MRTWSVRAANIMRSILATPTEPRLKNWKPCCAIQWNYGRA